MGRKNRAIDVFNYIDTHGNDPDVCWEWIGSLSGSDGRGYMTLDGKKQLGYRIVWEIFNGPIAEGMVIRHVKCDNPKCCNPQHLAPGTSGDNENDKYKNDRWGYTDEMLREIRRCAKLGMTYRAIAARVNEKFDVNISFSGVGKVIRGETRNQKK